MNARRPFTSVAFLGGITTLIAACGWVIDPDLLVAENGNRKAESIEPSCTPTGAEVCDDGIDNDCNGEVDCADLNCREGFVCVDPSPDGWTSILLAGAARASCPTGYTEPTDVRVVEGDGAATCKCDCGNNCGATIDVTTATDSTCATASATDTFEPSPTKCTGKSYSLPSGFAKATSTGTCTPTDTATKRPMTDGRTCTAPHMLGAGCPGAQRCVPKANGFDRCVAKAGKTSCPTSVFTKQWRSGTTADDQQTCIGCSCTSNPCIVALDLWTKPNCQGGPDTRITSSCGASNANDNLRSYKSTLTSGCTEATPSLPQGDIVFENEQTICCR